MSKYEIEENSNELIKLSEEVNIVSKFNYPTIIKFIFCSQYNFENESKPIIITEYALNVSLANFIKQEKKPFWNETQKLIVIYGIASAMSYLHSHDIIHHDLKPENILIDEFLLPKVADFGLSKIESIKYFHMTTEGLPNGTPKYMAPELHMNKPNTKASDVYAFAITIYEIIANEDAFPECKIYFDFMKLLINKYRPKFNNNFSEQYKRLIELCWDQDPTNRPSFNYILYLLKNDEDFITENINKNGYLAFVKYVDNYNSKFYSLKQTFNDQQLELRKIELIFQSTKIFETFPFKDFIQLDEQMQNLVKSSEKSLENMFLIGKYLIEGRNKLPQNTMLGLKYLKKSMKLGFIKSAIYFCEMLIKGKIIPQNIQKSKKINEKYINQKDIASFYLLYGKIYKKEKKYDESKTNLLKSIECNNVEAIYEYALILHLEKDDQMSQKYFLRAIDEGFSQAMYKYGLI